MIVENVTAVLKDIKVTKKGINITFEDVRLQGEQLQQLASLIGEVVLMGTDIPQMGLFEEEDVNEADEPEVIAEPEAEQPELLTDADISKELGINIVSGQTWVKTEPDKFSQEVEV